MFGELIARAVALADSMVYIANMQTSLVTQHLLYHTFLTFAIIHYGFCKLLTYVLHVHNEFLT